MSRRGAHPLRGSERASGLAPARPRGRSSGDAAPVATGGCAAARSRAAFGGVWRVAARVASALATAPVTAPKTTLATVLAATITISAAPAAELLSARVTTEDGETVSFHLDAESRNSVVGGTIALGSRTFTITRVSRSGLIGARRDGDGGAGGDFAEFVLFSSSFSLQTAVGQPWLAAQHYVGCDAAYNSFLAVYRVEGVSAIAALGPAPYPRLAEDLSLSRSSHVYCFVSMPPASG